MKKLVLLAVLLLALVFSIAACNQAPASNDTTVADTTVETPTEEATTQEAITEEVTTGEVTTEEVTTEEAATEEATTEEDTTEEVTEAETPAVEKLEIDISTTVAVATDETWIANQHLLGPRVLADDTTGQINAINVHNNNFLGDTGYGNVIVGGYISVGEIDLSKYSSVTLLVAGGGAGQTSEAWIEDTNGNKLNEKNASFTAGAVGVEGTQTIRTITIDLSTDYNGEVRFLFTQANVVTIVGITFQ